MQNKDELISQAAELLSSTRSQDRMRGVKLVSKHALTELGEQLYAAFLREPKDARTWETKSEMIRALGLINFTPALEQIASIVQANAPKDTVTHSAAAAYIRLTREDINDASGIVRLVKTGSYSVAKGALAVLAVDLAVPRDEQILEILNLTRDIHKHSDRMGAQFGLIDPRIYVAASCANRIKGAQKQEVKRRPGYCTVTAIYISSQGEERVDTNLIEVCALAKKGKFPKAYIGTH